GFGGVNRALAQLIAERNQQWKTELGFTLKIVGVTDLFLGSVMNRHGLDAASLARLPASKGAMAQLPGGTVDALNEAVIKDCGADIIAEA
ncbi:homoserine dehydrogenase, partial [Pseudomonas sp. SAICEU22]|nr:homoserine dehydrogenase [Pseudomonas agronomica]